MLTNKENAHGINESTEAGRLGKRPGGGRLQSRQVSQASETGILTRFIYALPLPLALIFSGCVL